jgi:hypothetical protein
MAGGAGGLGVDGGLVKKIRITKWVDQSPISSSFALQVTLTGRSEVYSVCSNVKTDN